VNFQGSTQPPMPPIPPGERPASRDDMTEVLSVLGEIRLILEEIRTLMPDTRKG
jgi:hypothetical protein